MPDSSSQRALLAALALGLVATSAVAPAAARSPAIDLAVKGTPVLQVVDPAEGGSGTAWVTFRTRRPVDAESTVVRIGGAEGRSFAPKGTTRCVRSTFVAEDGLGRLHVGRRYRVEVLGRLDDPAAPLAQVSARTVVARAFRSGRAVPNCDSAERRAIRRTPVNAFRAGVRAVARAEKARSSSTSVRCAPIPHVGDLGRCTGSFRLRKGGATATYRLTRGAATWRNTPSSIQYRVYARSTRKVKGLPRETGGVLGLPAVARGG